MPALSAGVPLTVVLVGAILVDSTSSGIVGSVESLSSTSSRYLGDFGALLPLGYAFGAGMVAAVNPCGFAMLPAYLALYMGSEESTEAGSSPFVRLARALLVGATVTTGFILLFGVAGLLLGGGARSVVQYMPWVGLTVGILLAFAGAWLLSGGKLYSAFAAQAASRIGDPSSVGVRGYFLFGLSYATASLSCTLPIFLAVIGTSLSSEGVISAVGQFLVYGLGMGMVIIALTVTMAFFKGAMVIGLRKVLPYTQTLSAAFMILAGSYIVFYWLTAGELLN